MESLVVGVGGRVSTSSARGNGSGRTKAAIDEPDRSGVAHDRPAVTSRRMRPEAEGSARARSRRRLCPRTRRRRR